MFKNILKRNKNKLLYAFTDGVSVDISEVKDEVFSQKMMAKVLLLNQVLIKYFHHVMGLLLQ